MPFVFRIHNTAVIAPRRAVANSTAAHQVAVSLHPLTQRCGGMEIQTLDDGEDLQHFPSILGLEPSAWISSFGVGPDRRVYKLFSRGNDHQFPHLSLGICILFQRIQYANACGWLDILRPRSARCISIGRNCDRAGSTPNQCTLATQGFN